MNRCTVRDFGRDAPKEKAEHEARPVYSDHRQVGLMEFTRNLEM